MLNQLHKKISAEMAARGYSLSDLEALTGVDRSQLSRFKNGQFKRISKNLLRVCEVLRIETGEATDDKELVGALGKAWDGTEKGKKNLLLILRALTEW